jgi:hypothetical protein
MTFHIKNASGIAATAAALLFSLGLLTSSRADAAQASNGLSASNGLPGTAAIWSSCGIDPRRPLATAAKGEGR